MAQRQAKTVAWDFRGFRRGGEPGAFVSDDYQPLSADLSFAPAVTHHDESRLAEMFPDRIALLPIIVVAKNRDAHLPPLQSPKKRNDPFVMLVGIDEVSGDGNDVWPAIT